MKDVAQEAQPAPVVARPTQAGEIRSRWSWVEPAAWTDRMLAALEAGVKGDVWFSLVDKVWSPRALQAAWIKVRANGGAGGVDGATVQAFDRQAEGRLARLHEELHSGAYRPQAVRRVCIPKPDGRPRPLGIPTVRDRIVQGAVLSPLLANIYLHPLDVLMGQVGHEMTRYADDFVVLCRSAEEARQVLEMIQQWVNEAGLTLHPEKTRIVDMNEPGGFDFLGYHFERTWKWPRKSSLKKFKDAIRSRTRRTHGQNLEVNIGQIDPIVRGWYGYFKHSLARTFRSLDGWIRMRLRSILRKRSKRQGRGRGRDHQRWPHAFFQTLGLFTMSTAHASERQGICTH